MNNHLALLVPIGAPFSSCELDEQISKDIIKKLFEQKEQELAAIYTDGPWSSCIPTHIKASGFTEMEIASGGNFSNPSVVEI